MSKRVTCLLLALMALLACPLTIHADEAPAPSEEALVSSEEAAVPSEEAAAPSEEAPVPSEFAIFVSDAPVLNAHSILENGTTYVSACNVAKALCPDATATWQGTTMTITGSGFTLTAKVGQAYIVCNGRYLYVPSTVRLHPTNTDLLVPVRVLAKALGAGLTWDPSGVYLTPGTPLESGDTFYNAKDLDLIARVVYHESGNQPLAGKIAVANVILNRTTRPGFGGTTVSAVLSAPNQFTGATKYAPNAESIVAAKLALDGAVTAPGACWFNGVGKPFWASKHKSLIIIIGNHAFYG